MVVLKKINETKINVTYEYYPEDRQHLKPGVFEIDKITYDSRILKFAEQDCNTKTYSVYAYMGVGKIINDYLKKNKSTPDEAMCAWY